MNDLTNGVESLPPRREIRAGLHANGWRMVAAAALVLAALSIALTVALYVKVQQNREDATRQLCRQRNAERRIGRAQLSDQIAQTANLPDATFKQFGIAKQDALDQLRARRRRLHPIDCEALVRRVG